MHKTEKETTKDWTPQMVPAKHIIGIDPGAKTGFAVWSMEQKRLTAVETYSFWETIKRLELLAWELTTGYASMNAIAVKIENPNGNSLTFGADYHKSPHREKISQNVGMNKRDAQLIIEYCEREEIPVFPITPGKNSMTKMKEDVFKEYTGWEKRTSQHGRDAAMLVFKNSPILVPLR